MLDRTWLREMMAEESVRIMGEMLAADLNPRAAEILAATRRNLTAKDMDEALDFLRAATEDREVARARWISVIGPALRQAVADLRPN